MEQNRQPISQVSTSYAQAHTNTYDSDAKIQVDNWYKTNIEDKNLSKYIDIDTGFCNDRQIDKSLNSSYIGDGYGSQTSGYASWGRIFTDNNWKTTQTPILKCANKSRDLFTIDRANEGNKKLTYSVGLITSDETVFAGTFGGTKNQTYYLYTNQIYYTMSPYNFSSNIALIFSVFSNGSLDYNVGSSSAGIGLRPVINLRADTKLTGEGSETSPFEIVS